MVDTQDKTDLHSIRSAERRIQLLHEVVSIHSGTNRTRSVYTQPPIHKPFTQTIKNGIRLFVAWVFSNVGICVLVVGYLLLGAVMFQEIERRDGKAENHPIVRIRRNTVSLLWNITEKYNLLHPGNWSLEVDSIIKQYQEEVVIAEGQGFDGNDIPEDPWKSFTGALLYSITVITTIGYGHIVPKTPVGKIVSIFYAVLGVPLFLLYVSNIGDILATSFKWTYSRICKCQLARKRTINDKYRIQALTQQIHPGIVRISEEGRNQDSVSAAESFSVCSGMEENDGAQQFEDTSQVAVPISLSLTVMISYICGGAILFGEWEGWDFLDGFYFCFITLSTIGFGDILPGDAVDEDKSEASLGGIVNVQFIFCSLYILLGMAVITMCFNLMQEKVVWAVMFLGRKLGIVKSV